MKQIENSINIRNSNRVIQFQIEKGKRSFTFSLMSNSCHRNQLSVYQAIRKFIGTLLLAIEILQGQIQWLRHLVLFTRRTQH